MQCKGNETRCKEVPDPVQKLHANQVREHLELDFFLCCHELGDNVKKRAEKMNQWIHPNRVYTFVCEHIIFHSHKISHSDSYCTNFGVAVIDKLGPFVFAGLTETQLGPPYIKRLKQLKKKQQRAFEPSSMPQKKLPCWQ